MATRRKAPSAADPPVPGPLQPFNLEAALPRLRKAVEPFPKAALFELYDLGHRSLFEQLVACMISIRTFDEVTTPTARALFARARTPREMVKLRPEEIDQLIHRCTFHEPKAAQIHGIAQEVVEKHGGELPCDLETLLEFRGVGPKCAGLALGIACGQAHIGVDIHVHRVTNRWGYVETATPEKTMVALREKLAQDYWVEINALLVPFGKHICTGKLPKCSTCPLADMCQRVGVTTHR